MRYHGEIFENGERFMSIDSEEAIPLVTIKIAANPGMILDLLLPSTQARELVRHLNDALQTAGGSGNYVFTRT